MFFVFEKKKNTRNMKNIVGRSEKSNRNEELVSLPANIYAWTTLEN